jgi:methionyl-tRNA formyltransferase
VVIGSARFGGRSGGFGGQAWQNLRHSGLAFTVALGFDLLAPRIASVLVWPVRAMGTHWPRLRTLREHADLVGARYVATGDINGADIQQLLQEFRPDLVLSLHFDQILRTPFIAAARASILNLHPSLLPEHRGPCPSFWVLQRGDEACGVTAHRIVDESIDSGESVLQVVHAVPPGTSMFELDSWLYEEGISALLALLQNGGLNRPVASPRRKGSYEGFPSTTVIQAARRRGVRLLPFGYAIRRLCALIFAG